MTAGAGTTRAVVIAGAGSGVGKTSIALGVAAALRRRGLRVQPFKVGPDFLDPTYLSRAAGRTCYNLDGWMTRREYVLDLFADVAADADVAIIEGVMGLFDGASATSIEGSTAEIAAWLGAPVVLVVNAHGVARSLAAMVAGFASFEPGVRIAGVIANQAGTSRHGEWLAQSLAAAQLPPLVGCVPRGALPALASRHLGLVSADAHVLPDEAMAALADAVERHVDLDRLLSAAPPLAVAGVNAPPPAAAAPHLQSASRLRLGLARDEAFHFYYPDNLEMFAARGVEWVEFSPLSDRALPAGLAGLYIGGGYPEVHARRLAANATMLGSVRDFAASGRPIYAECGGLMYLARSIRTLDGELPVLTGVLPIDTAMLPRLRTLGYVEATTVGASLLGAAGCTVRGHEFHYSEVVADDSTAAGFEPAYRAVRRREQGGAGTPEGWRRGNVLAGYVHVHFASCPWAADWFVHCCEEFA